MRKDLFTIISSAIESVKPHSIIRNNIFIDKANLFIKGNAFNISNYKNIYVIGFGKASSQMAFEVESILNDKINSGFVVTNYNNAQKCNKIEVFEASHPILDENSLEAGKKIIDFVSKTTKEDLVICLISGGGSALLEKLPNDITLNEFQEISNLLIKSGAPIQEINVVRQSLSEIKGGKLLQYIFPSDCINLVLSDIIGDPIELIAGGPTVALTEQKLDALEIIKKYNLLGQIPVSIKKLLENSTNQNASNISNKVYNYIIGNNETAINSAKQKAIELGYEIIIAKNKVEGEARNVGINFAQLIKENITSKSLSNKPKCFLYGGETTVTVKGNGKGGRNQEFVLSALIEMRNTDSPFIIASTGTDGIDGPTDAAGAFVDQLILKKMEEKKLNPIDYLYNNDAYTFFSQVGGLIKIGPTGTNVMDIAVGLTI
ncbi:glycerate kinase [Melioribacteraceae bacterium 4301-Me]|uniref:glycerate kinase type-2 family protein n=1 Tax=Pyranulibacter aquaticus TaxID=3163344 RepID=UPI0035955BC4